ncbi:MAG: tripartite tricarboxylate transporter TctB family protein [Burkholderiaceae bacterium]
METALWILFAAMAFALSFEFDKDIEIYKFNATGWPRFILILTVLAALGHLYTSWRDIGAGSPVAADDDSQTEASGRLSVIAMLVLPLVYAWLLQDVGFYLLTPIFIFLLLWLTGERRWQALLSVTVALYGFLLLVFARWLFLNLPIGTAEPFYSMSNWFLELIRTGV